MSNLEKNSNAEEDIEESHLFYRRMIPFGFKFFVKDIEISKRDFLTLFLILNSLVFLLIGQIGLDLMILSYMTFTS